MSTLLVCLCSLGLLVAAYFTYGRFLSGYLFELSADANVPSKALRDDQDYVPTPKSVVFGHHFTSIAGTGPIVGPAIAVFWGWLPALLWVVFGAILIGGVHDMSALVISLRNRGQTLGEIAGRIITPRARILFLSVLALALWIVLAIFGLVIASIFTLYPESVLSVWLAMPVAVAIGIWAHRGHVGRSMLLPSLGSLAILYAAVYVGVYYMPINIGHLSFVGQADTLLNPTVIWTLLLLAYCFLASVLPVWLLLQPRDLVNSHQLFVALGLLVAGLFLASVSGQADLFASTEAISSTVPADAPPLLPFLFITIACGACSGFHCLVSSGTSSKQVACEKDARAVGYGAMLLESALAVIVILACTAGVGMGALSKDTSQGIPEYRVASSANGQALVGREAWRSYYRIGQDGGWANQTLGRKLAAFIEGGANFLTAIGIPLKLGIGIVAVLVASFAATTLDTATRLQRYVLQELGGTLKLPIQNKYAATGIAVGVGGVIAIFAGPKPGAGGMLLWPLFGATNQLLAGLALMVATFYLWRRNKTIAFLALPMLLMMLMPAWAMTYNLAYDWLPNGKYLLVTFGVGILALQIWIFIEGVLIWNRARGELEPQLPPLSTPQAS